MCNRAAPKKPVLNRVNVDSKGDDNTDDTFKYLFENLNKWTIYFIFAFDICYYLFFFFQFFLPAKTLYV